MTSFKVFVPLSLSFLIINIFGELVKVKVVAQETIYQQYSVTYNERDEMGAVNVQFRFAGNQGTTLVLTKPSSIKFDGIELAVDSNDFDGAF